jgi:chemotaxis protein CheX
MSNWFLLWQARGDGMPAVRSFDARFVNPFISSAMNAVGAACGVDMQRGMPYVKRSGRSHPYDVSGAIKLTGPITGLVTVNFTRPVICSLLTKTNGEPVMKIDKTVRDTVGKMVTMMAESAREHMEEAHRGFKVSAPMVIASRFQSHNYPLGVPCIVVPFKTAPGEFTIEVAVGAAD